MKDSIIKWFNNYQKKHYDITQYIHVASVVFLIVIIKSCIGMIGEYPTGCDEAHTFSDLFSIILVMILIWVLGYFSNVKKK